MGCIVSELFNNPSLHCFPGRKTLILAVLQYVQMDDNLLTPFLLSDHYEQLSSPNTYQLSASLNSNQERLDYDTFYKSSASPLGP
jgi:hypothetical protein